MIPKALSAEILHFSKLTKGDKNALINCGDYLNFPDFDFSVRIETYRVADIRRLIEKTWDWPCSLNQIKKDCRLDGSLNDDVDRIKKIIKLQKKTGHIWPYISYWADTIEELAEVTIEDDGISVPNHGDGWHRFVAAVEQRKRKFRIIFLNHEFENV